MARKKKYVIKTSTLRERIFAHPSCQIASKDPNTIYLANNGMTQVIQSVLWADGWRSVVGNGYFLPASDAKKPEWASLLRRNASARVGQAEAAYEIVRQLTMNFDNENALDGFIDEPAIEDVIADLEAFAI